jgi:antitoxin (DNA-binding transcriptional repressor) of toxin-antitoxin stability system
MAIDITVNIREAKTRLQEQRGKAQQGDRVILTNTGNPVAERTPVVLKAPRKPEVLKGKVMFSDSFFQPTD